MCYLHCQCASFFLFFIFLGWLQPLGVQIFVNSKNWGSLYVIPILLFFIILIIFLIILGYLIFISFLERVEGIEERGKREEERDRETEAETSMWESTHQLFAFSGRPDIHLQPRYVALSRNVTLLCTGPHSNHRVTLGRVLILFWFRNVLSLQ